MRQRYSHFSSSFFLYISIIGGILLLQSCTKNASDLFMPYVQNPQNDTAWAPSAATKQSIAQAFLPELAKPTLKDSFNFLTGGVVTFGDSLQIIFPPRAFPSGNTLLNSNIVVEATLARTKGDYIRYDKTTSSYANLLESGAYVNLKLTKGGKEVFPSYNSVVRLKIKDTLAKNNMSFFEGAAVSYYDDSLFSWFPSFDGKVNVWMGNNNNGVLGYDISTSWMHWFGSAWFPDSASVPKTRLNIILPVNFTNRNTQVYAVFNNRKTVVGLLSSNTTHTFYTTNIPVNASLTLISISKINNDYYWGSTVIQATGSDPIKWQPAKKSLSDISALLDKL